MHEKASESGQKPLWGFFHVILHYRIFNTAMGLIASLATFFGGVEGRRVYGIGFYCMFLILLGVGGLRTVSRLIRNREMLARFSTALLFEILKRV